MYNISNAFKQQIALDNRFYDVQLNFTLVDGTTLQLTNSDIWSSGLQFDDAVSGDSEFQIGSAIINKMSVSINNLYDTYTNYDFDGATVIVYLGIKINNTASEHFRRGTYMVTQSSGYNTSTIRLECLDYMTKFDQPYSMVTTTYPATLLTIVQHICSYCGVTLQSNAFFNSSFVVQSRPADSALSCRQMLAYVAQIACSYARMDSYGRLTFGWYNITDTPDHVFTAVNGVTVGLQEILITGVRVTEEFALAENEQLGQHLYGVEGYVLDVSGNVLIQKGTAQTVAETLGHRLVDTSFYTVDATVLSDPSVEVGDTATITDNRGKTVFFLITSLIFDVSGTMSIRCSAKAAEWKNATQYSELTKALVKARETSIAQISAYDLAMKQLTDLMSESFGVFKTEEMQQDGSSIYILHNKPTLQESNVQWKMTANGLAVSTDGGATWNAGIDSSGNAIVNVLSAIGVSADWITTGRLAVSDGSGQTVFIADKDTGTVYISGDKVFIGDVSATDAINQLSGALTITLSNEMQGIPVDSDGDYSTFPNVTTAIHVVYGGEDVTTSSEVSYSIFNITGLMAQQSDHYVYTVTSLSGDTGYVTFTAKYNTGNEIVQNSRRFNLYKVYAGQPGPAGSGTPARLYFLEADSNILKIGQDSVFKPSTLTFRAYYRDGNEENRHVYTGLFRVETTTDGVTWTTVEYPTENKTFTTYTPSDTTLAAVRCTLYAAAEIDTTYYGLSAGDYSTFFVDDDGAIFQVDQDDIIVSGGEQLDIQSAAVIKDVSSLSSKQVFDILTNNGEKQGLVWQNNKVYLNAEFIQTGFFRVMKNNKEVFYVDTETGEVRIVADSFSLSSGSTIDSIAQSKADTALSSAKTYADNAAADAVDSQTQTEIFNKLTNNSQNEGIYLSGTHVYVNASQIKSGYISADRIEAGTISTLKLATDAIKSRTYTYTSGERYSDSGTYFSLSGTGYIRSKNFLIDTSGNAYFRGEVNASSGIIGSSATNKITIGTNATNASIYSGMTSRDDTEHNGFYLGTNGIALGAGKFKVTNTGDFTLGGSNGIKYTASTGAITLGSNCSISWNDVNNKPTILTEANVTTITKNTITTSYINSLNVTAQNISATTLTGKTISSGTISGSVIKTGSRTGTSGASGMYITANGDLYAGTANQVTIKASGDFTLGGSNGIKYVAENNVLTLGSGTIITSESLKTTSVTASNLHVKIANVDGTIVADSVAAENITGTTISGKTISGGQLHIANSADSAVAVDIDSDGTLTSSSGRAYTTLDSGYVRVGYSNIVAGTIAQFMIGSSYQHYGLSIFGKEAIYITTPEINIKSASSVGGTYTPTVTGSYTYSTGSGTRTMKIINGLIVSM